MNTYDMLVIELLDNMEDDSEEYYAALPGIIQRAQEYLQRRLDTLRLCKVYTTTTTAGDRELTLPTDCLVVMSIVCNDVPLLQQTNEYLAAYWPSVTEQGIPKYWAPLDGKKVLLAPTPAAAYPVSIEYAFRVPTLTVTNQTNWFTENAPTLLFNACMMFSQAWVKNRSGFEVWKALTDDELMALMVEGKRLRREDTSNRTAGSPENVFTETRT